MEWFLVWFRAMARFARVVIGGAAHHVTQRGNGRQFLLASDAERWVCLDLLRQAVHLHGVSVLGYCLMSNHVHWVVIPPAAEALARAMKARRSPALASPLYEKMVRKSLRRQEKENILQSNLECV